MIITDTLAGTESEIKFNKNNGLKTNEGDSLMRTGLYCRGVISLFSANTGNDGLCAKRKGRIFYRVIQAKSPYWNRGFHAR